MAAEKGRAFVLGIGDGDSPEAYTIIGGMRTTALAINNELVDVTNKASGGWREILGGAGVRSIAITGAGVFTGSAAEIALQGRTLAASVDNYRITFESGDTVTGAFQPTTLDYAGDHNGERTYNLRLESSGAVVFDHV